MHFLWTGRRFPTISAVLLTTFTANLLLAQRSSSPSPGAGSTANTGTANTNTNTGMPNAGNTGNNPTFNNPSTTNNGPFANRPIFISGKVMFDDGSQPNTQIRIERVCSGNPRLEGYADSKGRFSFQLGSNNTVDTDASDASAGGFGRPGNSYPTSSSMRGFGGNVPNSQLWNCELRASYPGYRSDLVELGTKQYLDNAEIGTIVLHRLANVQGTTISITSALAPKQAQKDYEKATQLARKGKFDESEQRLQEATGIYPKYAEAWFALGQIQQRGGKTEDAGKSFRAAIAADTKYVSPYDQLALIAAQESKWQEAADFSRQAISLNPVEFPSSFWYNALANYNLKNEDAAEKSTRDLIKLDPKHRYPEAESMLAQISLNKGNYSEAAVHLKAYLAIAPNAKNADEMKRALLKIEEANATQK